MNYEYRCFRGSLAQISFVFRKDLGSINYYLSKGYCVKEAISLTETLPCNRLSNVYGKDMIDFDLDFKLTNTESELVIQYLPLISKLAKSKLCNDEEILLDCELYLCYLVHNYFSTEQALSIGDYIRNSLLHYMLRQIRLSYDKKYYTVDNESIDWFYTLRQSDDYIMSEIRKSLYTLTDRERFIIVCRFGIQDWGIEFGSFSEYDIVSDVYCLSLNEIARLLNLSNTSIRQIKIKALKKLKRCNILKYFYNEVY